MTTKKPEQVLEDLKAATAEAREVLSETRGLVHDLINLNIYTRQLIERHVDEEVSAELQKHVDVLGEEVKKAISDAVAKVGREFARLENRFLGLDRRNLARGKKSLQQLGEEALRKNRW